MVQTAYFCSAEWHLRLYMRDRLTMAALLYPFALGIAKDGKFYCAGERLAEYFDCSPTTIYAAIQLLEDLDFFVYIGTLADNRKKYQVLTHNQWAESRPGR